MSDHCEFCDNEPAFRFARYGHPAGDYQRFACVGHADRVRRLIDLDFGTPIGTGVTLERLDGK